MAQSLVHNHIGHLVNLISVRAIYGKHK